MFDAEKLLGKIVGEVMGSGGKHSKLSSSLGAGSGLMTMIGLGVGAYEILKQQGQQGATGTMGQAPPPPGASAYAAGNPPPPPGTGMAPPPPPPMPGAAPTPPPQAPVSWSPPPAPAPSATTPTPPPSAPTPAPSSGSGNALAIRMIQVMAAAAHADGVMDADEERAVLDKLRGAELTQEEKMFLLGELHQPKSIDVLVEGITDPGIARTMYMLAVAAIDIDTEAERTWLDTLASRLGISTEMKAFLEEQGQ